MSATVDDDHVGDPRAPIADGPARLDDLHEDEFQRLAGAWWNATPADVAELLVDAPFRWWIVGGWALELAGAEPRRHKDVDVAFSIDELPALRLWVNDHGLDFWAPSPHGYRSVLPGDRVHDVEEQFWIRREATAPWLLDLLATPIDGEDWVCKKDDRIRRPLAEVARVTSSGVPHFCPEVVLLHVALRDDPPPSPVDVDVLDGAGRSWLARALTTGRPGHPWIPLLA